MKLWLPLLLLTFPRFAVAQIDPAPAGQFVRQYAAHYRVSPEFVAALIDVESRWNPLALSNKGAIGLMQLSTCSNVTRLHPALAAIWRSCSTLKRCKCSGLSSGTDGTLTMTKRRATDNALRRPSSGWGKCSRISSMVTPSKD